jgi:methylated-DNA-[protein]-cysteine S-methyltransferase
MLTMMKTLPSDAAYTQIESPVGKLWLIASDVGLHAILWEKDLASSDYQTIFVDLPKSEKHPTLNLAVKQLREYFSGKRRDFDLPLVLAGTDFQKRAWQQLTKIPYGHTISYREQAQRLGDAKKARAVGTANSRNPISIVIPCHRVIASSGALSGYGGGTGKKDFLIQLEQTNIR